MKFTFTCKKVALNDSVKEYAEKKISKLDRYFREDADAIVTFAVEKDNRCVVEVTIRGGGTLSGNRDAFGPIAPGEFSGRANQSTEPVASRRSDEYWAQNRKVELTAGEQNMGDFLGRMERGGAFRYIMLGLKLLVENYIETGVKGRPSKVDIGPVNTMVSTNFIDGLRTRMSAQTTVSAAAKKNITGRQ